MDNILLENILNSEFTFGYELEANVDDSKIPLKYTDNYPEYDIEKLYKKLEKYFRKFLGDSAKIKPDDSLNDTGFELEAPYMNLTPLNIKKCIDFLLLLKDSQYKIFFDDKCGFHCHLAFPTITVEDCIWLSCQLSFNDDMINELSTFTLENNEIIDFYNEKYADKKYLNFLKQSILDFNFENINKIFNSSDEKYRLIRIHPQGTLEWRGPRNFLQNNNIQDIMNFFKKIFKITKWISNTLKINTINGMDKSVFFKMLLNINPYLLNIGFNEKTELYIDKFIQNPLSLTKITDIPMKKAQQIIDGIYQYFSNAKKFNKFLIPIRYNELNKNILTNILIYEPLFYKYCVQPLPINEIIRYGYKGLISSIIEHLNFNDDKLIELYKSYNFKMEDFLIILNNAYQSSQGQYNPYTENLISRLASEINIPTNKFKELYDFYIH